MSLEKNGARVVLTIVGTDLSEAPRFRFMRNMPLLQGVSHPRLQRIRDFGEKDGLLFYVADFVDGRPILEFGTFSVHDACRVVCEAAEGVAAANAQQICAGGLTPNHVLLTSSGTVIAGFGIQRILASLDEFAVGNPRFLLRRSLRRAASRRGPTCTPSAPSFTRW